MIGINVEVDIQLDMFDANIEQQASEVVDTLAEMARAEWIRLAGESLHTTASDYINSIQPIEKTDSTEAVITLTNFLPNAIESGVGEYDLKEGMLKNAEVSKDGSRYRSIRFEKGSPTQRVVSPLPQDIYSKAKELKPGQRLKGVSGKSTNSKGYEHKSSIYEGLGRKEMSGSSRAVFENFRTVSDKSSANSWVHPGFKGLRLSEKVKDFIDSQAQAVVESIFK